MYCGARTCRPTSIGESEDLAALKRCFDGSCAPCEMFDTLAILKNLFGVTVMLTSSTSHVPGEGTEFMHDLRDVMQMQSSSPTNLAYAATTSLSGVSDRGKEARSAPTVIGKTQGLPLSWS